MDPLAPLRETTPQNVLEKPTLGRLVSEAQAPNYAELGRKQAQKLLADKTYQRLLKKRLREGKLGSNAMELMLWDRAYGVVPKHDVVVNNSVGIQVVKAW